MAETEPSGLPITVVDLANFKRSREPMAPEADSPAWLPIDARRSLTVRQVDHRRRMLKHLGTGHASLGPSALLSPDLPLFGQIR
jgi:hypothetical protein